MESIADLDINLPWVVPVEATEGLPVVKVDSAVGHVQSISDAENRSPKSLPRDTSKVVCPGKLFPGYGWPGKALLKPEP